MKPIVYITLLLLQFLALFGARLLSKRSSQSLLFVIGFLPIAGFFVLGITNISQGNEPQLIYTLWIIGVMVLAEWCAMPFLKRRAGPLILQLENVSRATVIIKIMGAIGFICVLVLFGFSSIPNRINLEDGKLITDTRYWENFSRDVFILVPIGIFLLNFVFQKAEMRVNGMLREHSIFWEWKEFNAYGWKNTKTRNNKILLVLYIGKKLDLLGTWAECFTLSTEDQIKVDNLLENRLRMLLSNPSDVQ